MITSQVQDIVLLGVGSVGEEVVHYPGKGYALRVYLERERGSLDLRFKAKFIQSHKDPPQLYDHYCIST